MQVIVQLQPDLARLLQRGESDQEGSQSLSLLRKVVSRHGGRIEPLHPGSAETALETYSLVELPDSTDPGVVEQLSQIPGVQGAYTKPPDEAA